MRRHLGYEQPFIGNPSPEQLREWADQDQLLLAKKSIEVLYAYLKLVEDAVSSEVALNGMASALEYADEAVGAVAKALFECGYLEPQKETI